MNLSWRSMPGMVGLAVVVGLFALLFLPGGDLTRDVSSYGVGREGYRLGFDLLESVGYDVDRFNHGVELLPDGAALWLLDPGESMLDEGPAGMGGILEWVQRGNTLLLAMGGSEDKDWLRHHVLRQIDERRSETGTEAETGAETETEAEIRSEDRDELLAPRGTIYEALAVLGITDVRVHGSRTPMEVGFDDPMAVFGPLADVETLRAVRHAPFLSGEGLEAGQVLVEAEQGPLVWRRSLGAGQLVLVTDGRLLCNWAVAAEDNGYLLVNLAHLTGDGRTILVEEFSHGYASATSLPRLLLRPPAVFVLAQLLLLLVAAVAWRARRFGPALPVAAGDRRFKAEHVHALADLHRRGKHHGGAVKRLRAQLLARWRERFALGRVMTDTALFAWLARRS
ncbi:MAG: DUF4350 domain-containing protein, partial [Myxococcota bacterium]|nr:DUF4350 domain-containing protein [Myxococcota bacterium]